MQQRVAMAIGDAGGIGIELAARVLTDPDANNGDLIVFGDQRMLDRGAEQIGASIDLPVLSLKNLTQRLPKESVLIDLGNVDPASAPVGKATEAGGRAALQNFAAALLTADAGLAHSVFFTPFNKHAMRLARPDYVDEIGYIDAVLETEASGREFNVLDEVWNARVTSHIPISAVAEALTEDRVYKAIQLTRRTMEGAGFARPRIGVAALNPHAGDGRNFGDEDEDVIRPAVERAAEEQIAVTGPIPADTVFVRATRGEFDAVLTMYHDQGQIAMKLLGFDRGVSLVGGYDFPIVTPAHGTAYDIAGKGVADTGATFNAVSLGRKLAAMQNRAADPEKVASLPARIASLVSETVDA